jgi:hypothetical protein
MMLLLFLLTSCSKSSTPLTPDQMEPNGTDENPVVVADSQIPVNPHRGVFGAWEVNVDVENLTAEIIPARNAHAIGDIYDADLLQFLTVSPCANCIRITRIAIEDWYLEMDVGIKHPFDNITARPDLHGFDVRLIFMYGEWTEELTGINVMLPDGSEEVAVIPNNTLVNADGFTSHFDSIVTDERYFVGGSDVVGNMNPYLRYFRDNATGEFDPHAPLGQNVMPVGSAFETRTAQLGSWGWDGLRLYMVADVAYGHSATYLNRPDPQYYLPEFHRTEPWRIEYWNENNNLDGADPASTADVMIQVFDWQHGATVDPDYPNPDNLSGISQSSNVSQLELLLPALQDDPIIVDTPESGTGTPQDPLTYRLQVTNEKGNNYTYCAGLLAVRDELYGQTGRMPIPVLPAGFPYDTEDILDYTCYSLVYLNNPNSNNDYDGEIYIQDDDLYARYGNTTIRPQFFMDPGGKRFQYRWDYDYDGITFDDDGGGNPSPSIEFTEGGIHNVGLRIRTNSKPAREYIYTIPITVNGTVFEGDIDSTVMEKKDCTSYNRSAAIGWSSDYYYCAFTSEASPIKRDVWLAVYDFSTGLFTSQNLTAALSVDCFHPAITVIEDGEHDRVVVVFNIINGLSEWHLYSTWGNLDGSNFLGAHITPLGTTRIINAFADTVFQYDKIFAYYWSTPNPFMEGNIEIAYSGDYGETWNIHPTLIDNGSKQKFEPIVVYSTREPRTYVIWEDCRDSVTNGTDLYIARSWLGLNFEPVVNISNFIGDVDEQEPEAVAHGSKIAITYLADPDGVGNSEVWVKLLDVYDELYVDFKVGYASATVDCLRPSIGMAVDNKMAVAYLSYDTGSEELTSYVRELESYGGFFDLRIYSIYNESAGSIAPSAISFVYSSGVVCRSLLDGDAYEAFAVWTGFNHGSDHDTTPFTMYFGDIECISVIRDGDI